MPNNFAYFDGDSFYSERDDESDFDEYLTVLARLQRKFGKEHGREIYDFLYDAAIQATTNVDAEFHVDPGLLFTGDGGEFVGFEASAD